MDLSKFHEDNEIIVKPGRVEDLPIYKQVVAQSQERRWATKRRAVEMLKSTGNFFYF